MSFGLTAVQQFDLPVRLGFFFLAHVVLYLWTRYVVAPARVGTPRLVRASFLVPVIVFLTFLFRLDRPSEFIPLLYCSHNFLWLTLLKLWAFCLNRGQLVRSYETGSHIAFALSLLFPIVVAFASEPLKQNKKKKKGHTRQRNAAYEDAEFALVRLTPKALLHEVQYTFGRLIAKTGLMIAMDYGYRHAIAAELPFWRDACLGWFLYGITSFIEDIVSLGILLVLNIKLETNFDTPWVAKSVTELWSRRYNLVFAQTFRDLIYDPICQGSWVHGPKYFARKKPSPLRKAMATLAAFGMSGITHMIAIWMSLPLQLPWCYGLFFAMNGVIVVLESVVKRFVSSPQVFGLHLESFPGWISHVYTISVIFALNHLLLWRELVPAGMGEGLTNGVMCFLRST